MTAATLRRLWRGAALGMLCRPLERGMTDDRTLPLRMPLPLGLRLAVVSTTALWLGGLCFYALVVVPSAHVVMGSAREAGFLTQRVTIWLNVIAAATLVVLLAHLVALRGASAVVSLPPPGVAPSVVLPRRLRRWLVGTWLGLLLLQGALFLLHPWLDGMLDVQARRVLDEAPFYALHRVYLLCSTAQLGLGLWHAGMVLAAWRSLDRGTGTLSAASA